jgi:hypothetical protein
MSAMQISPPSDRPVGTDRPVGIDRRHLLRLGGFSVAAVAVISACGTDTAVNDGTAGSTPAIAPAAPATFSDVTLLRTATSLQYSGIDAIKQASATAGLDPNVAAFANSYLTTLKAQADLLAKTTTASGGTPFEKPNPKFSSVVVTPALHLVTVSSKPASDAARLIHAIVSHAGETFQFFAQLFNKPALRATVMQVGVVHASASALLASLITPGNIVTSGQVQAAAQPEVAAPATTTDAQNQNTFAPTAAPPTTKAAGTPDVAVFQVPSVFGTQSAVQVVLGDAAQLEDDKKRQTINMETLFLNSFVNDSAT